MRLALAGFALLASACGGVSTHRVSFGPVSKQGESAPRTPTVTVELIEGVPARPFTELGIVQAIGHGNVRKDEVARALAQEARRMGCDAVVKMRVDDGAGMAHAIGVCAVW